MIVLAINPHICPNGYSQSPLSSAHAAFISSQVAEYAQSPSAATGSVACNNVSHAAEMTLSAQLWKKQIHKLAGVERASA